MVGGRETTYQKLAARMAEMGVQDEVVAAYEIGAFAYHYPGPILDLWGLVSPEVVGMNSADIIDSMRPAWVMTYVDMLPPSVESSSWFQGEYKPIYALGQWEGRRATLFRRFSQPEESDHAQSFNVLGQAMALSRVEVRANDLVADRTALHVSLQWKALSQMERRYTIYLHIRDAANRPISQHDGEPQANQRPTTGWQIDELVVDKHDLVVDNHGLDKQLVLVIGGYETDRIEQLLHWADPSVPQWPHELRIPLSPLVCGQLEYTSSESPALALCK